MTRLEAAERAVIEAALATVGYADGREALASVVDAALRLRELRDVLESGPIPDEPQIHSHITDTLPDKHPLAWQQVHCVGCRTLLHAANNECMMTWIEAGRGNFCVDCFSDFVVLGDEDGLKVA